MGRHGIHSPFFYQLMEEVVRGKKLTRHYSGPRKKEFHLQLRFLHHFQPKKIWLNVADKYYLELVNTYKNQCSKETLVEISTDKTPSHNTDYYFLIHPSKSDIKMLFFNDNKIKNSAIVIFSPLYASNEQLENWQQLMAIEKVINSLDFYHFGMLFFRKENTTQHYKIKYL